jgi:hypothetical protein
MTVIGRELMGFIWANRIKADHRPQSLWFLVVDFRNGVNGGRPASYLSNTAKILYVSESNFLPSILAVHEQPGPPQYAMHRLQRGA